MIVVEQAEALDEFARLYLGSLPTWPAEYAGAMFWGFLEPGHSNTTFVLYRSAGQATYAPNLRPTWAARETLLDIPDEVDPARAHVAAVIVTYRVSDESWVARVAFGDEAEGLRPDPMVVKEVARELCPLRTTPAVPAVEGLS